MRGRPPIHSIDLAEALVIHIAAGGSIASFAAEAGVPRRSLTRWKARWPKTAIEPQPAPFIPIDPHRPVISLAAWGIPHRTPTPISGRIITDEDVDDMLAEAA